VVALLQTEFGNRHSHGYFPTLALLDKCSPQLGNKVVEHVPIAEATTAVTRSRILPVQVESVKAVQVHEIDDTVDEGRTRLLLPHHGRVLGATFGPTAHGNLHLQFWILLLQRDKLLETTLLHIKLRVDDEHLIAGLGDADKGVDDVGAKVDLDVVNVEFADVGSIDGPIAVVANDTSGLLGWKR
jgi:hypothetical protein